MAERSRQQGDEVRAIKFFLKDHFPAVARLLQPLQPRYVENIFTRYYQKNQWHDSESVSGDGSSLRRTLGVRQELPALLRQLGVNSLLDAVCGDFHWLRDRASVSQLRQQAIDHGDRLLGIAPTKQIRVIEHVIQVV
jgi:hypothetical protein